MALGAMLAGTVVALPSFPSVAPAAATTGGYHVVVEPIYATPGQAVFVTGTPKYTTDTGFYGTTCDNETITATVTYYTASGTVKVVTTDLGKASGIIGIPEAVTIPADAQPTRVDLHYAEVQASCQAGTVASPTTYSSASVAVTVTGSGATTPTITSFTPTSGTASGGTKVTITGTHFSGSGSTTTSVQFGSTTATSFSVTSPTQITAVTEAHAAGTVTLKVTTNRGAATAGSDYKYTPATPTISSFTPTSGTTSGGTSVTITGGDLLGATAVKFGTTTATSFAATSPTQITAVTEAHVAGTVTLRVTTAGGTATAGSDYKYTAPTPTITSFTPTSGTTSGGTSVTITGTGLFGAAAVKFGTTAATSFAVTRPTQITAVTEAHVAGTVTLRVTTAGGTATAGSDYDYTVAAATTSTPHVTPGTTPPANHSTTTATVTPAATTAGTPVAEYLAQTGSDIELLFWLGTSLVFLGSLLLAFDARWRRQSRRGVQRR
jgi:hypothetical protein